MLINRERFAYASIEIDSQNSRQLKAISMMSLLRSKCCDFSLVKTSMNDLMSASLSSAFGSATCVFTVEGVVLERAFLKILILREPIVISLW